MAKYKSDGPYTAQPPPAPTHRAVCQYCDRDLPWLPAKMGVPKGDHIVGVSRTGGQICNICYQRPCEPDYREEAFEGFDRRHQGDMWGSTLSIAKTVRTREDARELLGILKREASKIGKLPYAKETAQ